VTTLLFIAEDHPVVYCNPRSFIYERYNYRGLADVVLDQEGIKREGEDLPPRPPEKFLTRLVPPNQLKK
jgi:hypothetical protein